MTPQRCRDVLSILQAYADGKEVQERDFTIAFHETRDWKPFVFEHLTEACYEYRIKPTTKRVPWTASDVPPVCWLTRTGYEGRFLVQNVLSDGLETKDCWGHGQLLWSMLAGNYLHSTDLKTWAPCSKEVAP